MKLLAILISLLILCNLCTAQKEIIPLNYQYPQGIANGKTYVFQIEGSKDLIFREFKIVKKGGRNAYSIKTYDQQKKSDSLIELNGYSLETYIYYQGNVLIKGKIIKDTVMPNGVKIKLSNYVINNQIFISQESHAKYLKDTTINFKGKAYECKVYTSNIHVSGRNTINNEKSDYNMVAQFYFGKNIGLLRNKVVKNGSALTFNLKEIRNLK